MNISIESLENLIDDQRYLAGVDYGATSTRYKAGQKLYLEVEVEDSYAADGIQHWLYGNDGGLRPLGLKLRSVLTTKPKTDLTKRQLESLGNVINEILYE